MSLHPITTIALAHLTTQRIATLRKALHAEENATNRGAQRFLPKTIVSARDRYRTIR